MAGTIKGITIEIGGDTQKLNKALEDVNKKSRDLQSELRQVERLLKLDPGNTELLAQKQKLLADAVENSREKLDRLKAAQEQVNEQFKRGDINEEQYRAFQREVIKAEQELSEFETQLKQTGNTAKRIGPDFEKLGNNLKSIGDKFKSIGTTMSAAVTAPIVGGFVALTQGTKEFRGDLARLEANAKVAGQEMSVLKDAMATLNAVTGETDSSVEGLSNLMATGFRDEQLTELLESLYGASIKFSDTLKFEGISDGLQETLATGAAIGPFAELLERSGIVLDDFNAGLQEAIKNGQEEEYILEVLASTGLAGTYEAWRKNNEEMVKAEEANYRMQESMAKLGATLEPILTPIIEKVTELVNKFNEADPSMQKVILVVAGLAAAIGPLLVVIGSLASALPVLGTLFAAVTGPIGLVVLAIAALGAAIVWIYNQWKENGEKSKKLLQEFGDSVKRIFEDVKTWLGNTWNNLKQTAANVWNGIKSAILNPIESAKLTIMGIIDTIRNAFSNMKITIPKPKLPHISVTTKYKSVGEIKIPYPDFDINWYKSGGIFKQPTIAGIGDVPEAVIPLDKLPGMIADTLREAMSGNQVAMAGGITIQNMYVRNDQDIKLIARELYNLQQQNARGRGLK